MYINDLKTKQLTRLYWIGALTIFTPVIIGLLFIKINMLVFVTLYSILSLAYWFICWCRTILKYVDNHDAWRVIAYVSTLLTTFVIVGELSQRFITFDSFFEILLLLILSWVVAMILTGIIFNSEMQLQKKFIVDRLPNPS
jgi:hypothetical protein